MVHTSHDNGSIYSFKQLSATSTHSMVLYAQCPRRSREMLAQAAVFASEGAARPPSTFWVRFPSPLISKKNLWRRHRRKIDLEGGREGGEVHSSTTRARIPKIRSRGNRTKVGGGLGLIWLIRRARIRYSNRYLLKAVGIELLMGFMLPSVRIPGCVNPHRYSAHVHVRVIDLGEKDSYDDAIRPSKFTFHLER